MKLTRVGITHGDINGIGLELIAKALAAPELMEFCTPVVFSDGDCFMQAARLIDIEQPIPLEVIASAQEIMDGRVNLVNACKEKPHIEWGKQTEASLKAEADSLNAAIEAFKAGIIDVLVCAPGQLDNNVDGHSLSDFVRRAIESEQKGFDWILNNRLRILQLQPLEFTTELGEGIVKEAFKTDMKSIVAQLREDFGFIKPRIAIVSGKQDIASSLNELRDDGLVIFGPFAANEFIEKRLYEHYDAVLFQEEEEARHKLIASLTPDNTIGFASGMPLILTYPIQNVGYDMAGKSSADATAMRNAIYASIDICRSRRSYNEATRKPLEKQWVPKCRDDFKLDLTKEDN
ncbi:MAG: hypothetical protein E7070_08205 [Bacteroidales bacterium]|jgi:4-hydroxythreonine-4-phosphate dehydrogenase|nr:hypothetical protein [Bacteroidales bacterium]